MKKIYLDYAATTPLDKEVEKVMRPYYSKLFGNPMSLHSFGREASEAVEKSRTQVANFLGSNSKEIIFTSGATESNNLAIRGVVLSYWQKGKKKPHIITTSFEHHCVLNTCQELEKEGLAEVTFIKPDKSGVIDPKKVARAIRPETILISIMYVNNEIGTIQPIAEIGKIIKKLKTKNQKLFLHTDATQAINYLDCNVKKLGVDLLSLSAHKIYGPKGVGCLYVKRGTPLKQIQLGGDQENGKRAGTHNVPGIVGLGKAISLVDNKNNKGLAKLRDWLIKKVLSEIPDSWLNGDSKLRTPNNINFGFRNVEGEALILMLDSYGIATSTGSACSSGSLEPSHVLLSLGLRPEEAHGSLRITLGKQTTQEEIKYAFKTLKKVVSDLRKISGNVLDDYYKNNSSQKSIKS
ncbi:MAG: cysteine desulfurase family protein [Patescibacteria group bacterium]